MAFRQIDCFIEVARRLSFTDAANALFLSQSAVSQQIRSLESDLGFKLLARDQKGTKLTKAGEHLLRRLQDMKVDYQSAVDRAREISECEGEFLAIGYDGPMSGDWFAKAAMRFHESCPEVTLRLRKEPVSALTQLLMADALDVIVTHRIEVEGISNVAFMPLSTGGCCLFVATDNPLARQSIATVHDLADQRLLVDCEAHTVNSLSKGAIRLMQAGVDFRDADAVSDGDVIFSMVEAKLGVFIASHLCDVFASKYHVVSVDMDIDVEDATMGLAWKYDRAEIDAFRKCARRQF